MYSPINICFNKQLTTEESKNLNTSGEPGDLGDPGSPGIDGMSGSKGEQGVCDLDTCNPNGMEKGRQGEPGLDGEDGPPGLPGSKGEQGEPGPQGEKGEKGVQGEEGVKGPAGLKGEQGDIGSDGLDSRCEPEACKPGPGSCEDTLLVDRIGDLQCPQGKFMRELQQVGKRFRLSCCSF